MVIRFFVCFIFACMYLLNWKRNDRHVFLLTLASFSEGYLKHKPDFASEIKASFTVHYKFCVNILRNKDKTAFHSFSLDSVCNQVLIFQNLFHIHVYSIFSAYYKYWGLDHIHSYLTPEIWPWDNYLTMRHLIKRHWFMDYVLTGISPNSS